MYPESSNPSKNKSRTSELLTTCFCELGAFGKSILAELQFSYLKIITYLGSQ